MNLNIAQRVLEQVEAGPERPSIHFRELTAQGPSEHKLTYGELWQRASAFSAALDALPPDSHVMIVMSLGPRLLAAHLGVQLHGCAASIFTHPSEKVNPEVYGRNLEHAVATLHPDAVIVAREFITPLERALSSKAFLV